VKFIDTHTHLFDSRFDTDRQEAVARAVAAGVDRMVLPATDLGSHGALIELAKTQPEHTFAAMGVHPTSINDNPAWRDELAAVERCLEHPPVRFCAVGEIGLDLHWSRDFLAEQQQALRFQIELALRHGLPVLVHNREAFEETFGIFSDYASRGLRGIFHSFSGTWEEYRALRSLGDFKFGIAGVVTYKKSQIAELLPRMDPDDLVLETDAPYLPPVPYRGRRNESAWIPLIAEKVAGLLGLTLDETARITTRNALEIFDFKS
jgi:TatD DNase family protein